MPMSSKFLTVSTGDKNVQIGQYIAKIWKKYDSLLFWANLYARTSHTHGDDPGFGCGRASERHKYGAA